VTRGTGGEVGDRPMVCLWRDASRNQFEVAGNAAMRFASLASVHVTVTPIGYRRFSKVGTVSSKASGLMTWWKVL
jgi:hypothetical protein